MKLRAKILSKYAEQIKASKKRVDYRQFESIAFELVETGEIWEFDIERMCLPCPSRQIEIREEHTDVLWKKDKEIYAIYLGGAK